MGSKQKYQFQVILYDLAKSLAAINNAPWERVKLLYSYCPQIVDDHFVLYSYSLDCIIALGTYYIQSEYCHTEKIVPYLLNLLKGLTSAKWCHENDNLEVPYTERFSFCLNTLLSEISTMTKKDIFIYQTNEITNIYSSMITDLRNGFKNWNQKRHFYSVKLPVFLGLIQSMTRYCRQAKTFFCYVFPKHKEYVGIIHHIKVNYESPHINLVSMICKQASQTSSKSPCCHSFTRRCCDYSSESVMNIVDMVYSLLSDETMRFEDNVYSLQQPEALISHFYFNNFSEILKCAILILFRDVLYQKSDFTYIIDDIKDFVDEVYLSTQKSDESNYLNLASSHNEEQTFQKLKINVLTKVTCLEILVWFVKDISDGEDLCMHVTSSLKNKQIDNRVVLINAPYTIACMNVLGTLAGRFPNVSDVCVKAMQDFLSSPSSTLTNLCKSISQFNDDVFLKKDKLVSKGVWFEYCIFKKVQNSAIENLCASLKSMASLDGNYIPAFLTKFSSLLFMEKHHPQYGLVIENVVVSLGHISYSIPSFSLAILQCFQQRLCRHSVESDIAIIHQLGNMLIVNNSMDVFLGVLKIFSNMMLEVHYDTKKELLHISKNLFHVLLNVADRLQEHDKIVAVFIRSLEIFVQAGLDVLRSTKAPVYQYDCITTNQENLLHVIGLLSTKLGCNNKFKKQQERLFQDFWLYFVLSGKELVLARRNYSHLNAIVPSLPTLTSESLTDHDLREFFYTSSLNKITIPPTKSTQLKSQLLNFLTNTSEISIIINKLSFPQIIYLHSMCALEIIRIENSKEPSIEFLFNYLTNVKLQKDRYGIWQCICKVAEEIFAIFLKALLKMERNDARELVLENQVQILLINFNNVHSQIRHIADKFLSEFIDAFPHLLWNRQVLWSVIDIVALLHYSLIIDSNDQTASLKIPNTNYYIFLMDTKKSREEIFSDFVARSREIISEARKWAPTIINSHLQEYIIQDDYLFPKIDPICRLRHCAWTLLSSNEKAYHEISDVISSITIRSRFIGEVAGLMKKSGLSPNNFGKSLAEDVWEGCHNQDLRNYQTSVQRATAFAITQQTLHHEIKHALTRSHIKFFTEETVSTVVHCWNWLCTVHPEFELEFLMEMFEAWQYTVDNKIGLFSTQNISSSEMLNTECVSHPHNIWIEFIVQQISSSKYAYQDKLDMAVYFLHNTLPMNIGGSDCIMSRNVENIIARFSLLSSALALIQYDIPISCIDRVILRQRIYCSCLDYFCCLRKFPSKNGLYLQQKIDVLVQFWHVLYSDKKHILKHFATNEIQESIPNLKENLIKEKKNITLSLKMNSLDSLVLCDSFSTDIFKKRKLALCLLAEEIEFLSTWCKPSTSGGENKIRQWQSNFFTANRSMCEFSKMAWDISHVLSVYLPVRLRHDEQLTSEISKLILLNPESVSHIPHAMTFLATEEHVQKDRTELVHLLSWVDADPLCVINLLSRNYKPHPIVLQYVIKTLLKYDFDSLVGYIPQLVQALRYDTLGYVHKLLFLLSQKSQLFCHQLIWNIKSNMFTDINMTNKSTLFDNLNSVLADVTEKLTGPQKVFYEREFKFVDQITEISIKIPKNLKQDEKRIACLNALKSIKLWPGCYLPSSPEALICDIDYSSGTPLQSKTRTPYLANFLVYPCSSSEVHEIGMQVSEKQLAGYSLDEIATCEEHHSPQMWQRTIFKAADDVRQDILALQTIQYLKDVFQTIGLDVFLFPYKVIAIAPAMGVIECIPNASSRDQLGKQTNVDLYDYFVTTFGDEKSARFQEAQRNFIKSVAAYSLIIFLLQIKDRHNGNIMVDDEGHIIHIDYGFMFESSPGGNLGFEPDMKLTEEMVMIMGGGIESEPFQYFIELCVKAYLAARHHKEDIITLVTMMLDSGLPCFRGQTIKLLQGRFAPNASDREAADYIITVIKNSCLNFRTVTYDMLQYLQNSIQY